MKIVFIVVRTLLGALFILSGALKIYPIEPFELSFVDMGVLSWTTAPIAARLFIGLEMFTGLLLLLNARVYKLEKYLCGGLLSLFTIYLAVLLILKGNNVDCGCFGEWITLTPIQSLIKNGIMFLMLALIWKSNALFKFPVKWVLIPAFLVSFSLPFIINAVEWVSPFASETVTPMNFPLDSIPSVTTEGERINLHKGTHLIALFLPGCPHCKLAAKKLRILHNQYDAPMFTAYFFGTDDPAAAEDFKKESGVDCASVMFNNKLALEIANGRFPTVLLIRDGKVIRHWTGRNLSYDALQHFKDL